MTVTWSAIWKTRSMSCSTNRTGISADMVFTSARCADAFGHRKTRQRLIEQQDTGRRARQAHVEQALAAIGQ